MDELIVFLKNKIAQLDSEHREYRRIIHETHFLKSDNSYDKDLIGNVLKKIKEKHEEAYRLLKCFDDCLKRIDQVKTRSNCELEHVLDAYLEEQAKKEIKNNYHHIRKAPLLGYKPFHDKLIQLYLQEDDTPNG